MKYVGEELELFENAVNWKRYFAAKILPFINGKVLEVGAGIGSTSPFLQHSAINEWNMLEPDPDLAHLLRQKIDSKALAPNFKLYEGTIKNINSSEHFDTIIYIDVLEHIKDDEEELKHATRFLNPNGNIIVLSPAFQSLYSSFDKALGHHKRYAKKDFTSLSLPETTLIKSFYLDALGFFASYFNRTFLKQNYPTKKQILFWDKYFVPFSKIVDPLLVYSFGRSIIGIWKKK